MMKRLKSLLAVSVAALSLGASAASVKWSSGSYAEGFTTPSGSTFSGVSGYTLTTYFYTDAGTTPLSSFPSQSVSTATPNGALGTTTDSAFDADLTYYAKAVIVGTDSEGKSWTRETSVSQFTMAAQGDWSLNFTTGDGLSTSGNKWGEWHTSSVPEPFSGTLVLVGMAGLAIRRKLKKQKKA